MPNTRKVIRLLKAGRTPYEISTHLLALAEAEGCDLTHTFRKYEA
jgi:hypothetical protein